MFTLGALFGSPPTPCGEEFVWTPRAKGSFRLHSSSHPASHLHCLWSQSLMITVQKGLVSCSLEFGNAGTNLMTWYEPHQRNTHSNTLLLTFYSFLKTAIWKTFKRWAESFQGCVLCTSFSAGQPHVWLHAWEAWETGRLGLACSGLCWFLLLCHGPSQGRRAWEQLYQGSSLHVPLEYQ